MYFLTDVHDWSYDSEDWTEDFEWVLIEDGKIQYSFRTRIEAEAFRHRFTEAAEMLLLNAGEIPQVLMASPHHFKCWEDKKFIRVTHSGTISRINILFNRGF